MALTLANHAQYLRDLADRIEQAGVSRGSDTVFGDPRALRGAADVLLEIDAQRLTTPPAPIRERSTDEKITQLSERISLLEQRVTYYENLLARVGSLLHGVD